MSNLGARLFLLVLLQLLAGFAFVNASLRPIGGERQYFFDDEIVETLENTKLKLNRATKLADNPVIKRDRPWEGPDMRLSWVIFDHRLGKFRMRYSSGVFRADGRNDKGEVIVYGEKNEVAIGRITCEAFSDDGIHWEKPELGLVEFEGSKANNILPEETLTGYFLEDLNEPNPDRHYIAHVRTGTYDTFGMMIDQYFSPDGYEWTPYEGNPIIDTGDQHGRWGPTEFLGWDPIRKTYAVHMENNYHMHSHYVHRRSIGRAESPDMIHWSEPETIISVDNMDFPDTEFYHFPVTIHEGWYMGLLWVFSTTNTEHEPHFVFSRDGMNYDRTFREPLIRTGDNGDFDSVSVYAQRPLFHNDEVLFYYTGTNWRSPEQLLLLGDKATAGVGMARLPMDGFVSLEGARDEFSVVTTRSFSFTGENLFLNMRSAWQQWGAYPCEVKVELLDGRHTPIDGYTFADADNLSETGTKQLVSWSGKTDLSVLQGKPIRLRIHFKNAKLYTFQFR